jgi:hypothetical protein
MEKVLGIKTIQIYALGAKKETVGGRFDAWQDSGRKRSVCRSFCELILEGTQMP